MLKYFTRHMKGIINAFRIYHISVEYLQMFLLLVCSFILLWINIITGIPPLLKFPTRAKSITCSQTKNKLIFFDCIVLQKYFRRYGEGKILNSNCSLILKQTILLLASIQDTLFPKSKNNL